MESPKHSKSDASKRAMDSRVSVTDVRSDLFRPTRKQRNGLATLCCQRTILNFCGHRTQQPFLNVSGHEDSFVDSEKCCPWVLYRRSAFRVGLDSGWFHPDSCRRQSLVEMSLAFGIFGPATLLCLVYSTVSGERIDLSDLVI